jgi:hypothetical protein
MNQRERMRVRQGAQRQGDGPLSADGRQQDIDLCIDQLIVEGLQPADGYRFGNAVQTELARLLAKRGIPLSLTGPVEFARLAAGSISITSASRPGTIGRQVGEAVYRGFAQVGSGGGDSSGTANGRNRGGAGR